MAEDFPAQAPVEELKAERRRVDAIADRAVSEKSPLKASSERIQKQAECLQERMRKLALHADGGAAGLSLLDTAYDGDGAAGADEKAREADRRNDESLRRGAEALAAADARKASLVEEKAARRADLERQQREVEALEREQAAAVAAAAVGAAGSGSGVERRAEASRETENLAGVAGMSEAQLEACVKDEEILVTRNTDIRGWYAATVANLELVGGLRVSHRLLFGAAGGGGVEGMELMVDLGPDQVMEVTVSAVDGRLTSVQLCHGQTRLEPGAPAPEGGAVSPSDLEELRRAADALPAPQNLRMLVREALSRARCAAIVDEHLRRVSRRYLTQTLPSTREFSVTMDVGLQARFRLHADYPKVSNRFLPPWAWFICLILFWFCCLFVLSLGGHAMVREEDGELAQTNFVTSSTVSRFSRGSGGEGAKASILLCGGWLRAAVWLSWCFLLPTSFGLVYGSNSVSLFSILLPISFLFGGALVDRRTLEGEPLRTKLFEAKADGYSSKAR